MQYYSPFNKELSDIECQDLLSLKHATEGWYIEYKREVPDAASVAKSISAFANTYGGWLFYGITEESKENSVAGSYPGIPRPQVDQTLQRIRLAVAEQVQPSPHFDTKVIWGPCEQLHLQSNHAVICIKIPWSPNTPHIHKSGRIYRRISDGSEPKLENDRFILDQLWRRSENTCNDYKEWINKDPEFSKSEAEYPFIRLLIVPDLWNENDIWIGEDNDAIQSIFHSNTGILSGIPFDSFYTYPGGYVGRQLAGNDPHRLGLTWRLRTNLVSDIYIPLPSYKPKTPDDLQFDLLAYENAGVFIDLLKQFNHKSPKIVDLNYLFNTLSGIVEMQESLSLLANWKNGFYAKSKLLNMWRYTPFADVASILDRFKRNGPPMCIDSTVITPYGVHPSTFSKISNQDEPMDPRINIMIKTLLLFLPIAQAFGIGISTKDIENKCTDYILSFQAAGCRAMENQRLKNI